MKPQTIQRPRTIMTAALTALGIGLFVLIGAKAIHQISDRQYVVGKQHTISGTATINNPVAVLSAAHYETGVSSLTEVVAPQPAKSLAGSNSDESQHSAKKTPEDKGSNDKDKKNSRIDTSQVTESLTSVVEDAKVIVNNKPKN